MQSYACLTYENSDTKFYAVRAGCMRQGRQTFYAYDAVLFDFIDHSHLDKIQVVSLVMNGRTDIL
jgi:hypothetical protein